MSPLSRACLAFFSSNATVSTATSTLSLHDALPIFRRRRVDRRPPRDHPARRQRRPEAPRLRRVVTRRPAAEDAALRSEEHTSELQSHVNLVCRLQLEKKNPDLPQPALAPQSAMTPQ